MFCGAVLAGLGYALYSTAETVDPYEIDGMRNKKNENEGNSGRQTSTEVPSQGPLLASAPLLSAAFAQIAPLLIRVDSDETNAINSSLEQICACVQKAHARQISPTKALVEASIAKRAIFTKLKELNRVARRVMPLEASDRINDFNSLVNSLNDVLNNLEKESSLHLIDG